jgi:CDP-diacylglycerol--glycerol-3-phosphate 3-phosphatidyltransferase
MNLPNKLTLLRLVLTVFFVVCLSVSFSGHLAAALGLFLLATLTDYLDGEIARRWNLITDFGKLMDPLADKVLTASAFICLIPYGVLPAWAVIIIISREFLITGLRLLASTKGIVLPAEKLGKHKTAWQMISILYFLGLLAWKAPAAGFPLVLSPVWHWIGVTLVTITVALTLFSGLAYFWKNRHLLASA